MIKSFKYLILLSLINLSEVGYASCFASSEGAEEAIGRGVDPRIAGTVLIATSEDEGETMSFFNGLLVAPNKVLTTKHGLPDRLWGTVFACPSFGLISMDPIEEAKRGPWIEAVRSQSDKLRAAGLSVPIREGAASGGGSSEGSGGDGLKYSDLMPESLVDGRRKGFSGNIDSSVKVIKHPTADLAIITLSERISSYTAPKILSKEPGKWPNGALVSYGNITYADGLSETKYPKRTKHMSILPVDEVSELPDIDGKFLLTHWGKVRGFETQNPKYTPRPDAHRLMALSKASDSGAVFYVLSEGKFYPAALHLGKVGFPQEDGTVEFATRMLPLHPYIDWILKNSK